MFNIFDRFSEYSSECKIALRSNNNEYSYSDIELKIVEITRKLDKSRIRSKVIILDGDFNFNSIVYLLALIKLNNIVLLQTETLLESSEVIDLIKADIFLDANDETIKVLDNDIDKPILIQKLIKNNESGIILLSSGTTGKPKAILHSFNKLSLKYQYSKKNFNTLAFLLFDHIAGLDTLLYTISAGGTLITLKDRSPEEVIHTLKENSVEVLPTSPSFLNILLLYPEFTPENLPDLKIITFGSERINESTLKNLTERFNNKVRILQKYGITEMGSPNVISKPDDPAWIKIDNRNTDYKIENNILYLKSSSSMLGYIYHDHCEEFDGWYNTNDKVETDGEWIKILGRTTDIINVGGQKVYPAEVESIIMEIDNIKEVVIYGVDNPIMGKVVAARLELVNEESLFELKKRIRLFCKNRLETFKIPAIIEITNGKMVNKRYKKVR